jgi:metallo-beta-lactamase class B
MTNHLRILCFVGAAIAALMQAAIASPDPPEWTTPAKPFPIVSGIYYVGTKGLASYLFVSQGSAILMDGTLPKNAPLIERNIKALGFNLHQIKLLINSHAHLDHAGGLAQLKRDTGAPLYASAGDRWALEHGAHDGDTLVRDYDWSFPPVHVDRVLHDGETVSAGALRLRATLTPGHTRGCTTWSTTVEERGRSLNVVIPCSISVAGNVLVHNRAYPGIAADYRRSFRRLAAMKADVVLTNHPELADVHGREARRVAGDRNAFIAPGLLQQIVADARADFAVELAKQHGPK